MGLIRWAKATIISRLVDRFTLHEAPESGQEMALIQTIQPVTDVDELLRTVEIRQETIAVTGVATYTAMTIPAGKRWRLHGARAYLSTGTYTIDTIGFFNGTYRFNYTVAQAILVTFLPGSPLPLDQNWTVEVNVNTHAVNGNLGVGVLIEEEDAY